MISALFKQNLGTHLLGFEQWTSQNALNAGAVTGLTVSRPKEITLKGTRLNSRKVFLWGNKI